MKRRYLRFKKLVLLKEIYTQSAGLRYVKRQVPGGEVRSYRRATGQQRSAARYMRRILRARRNRRSSRGMSKLY
jgi:hypothetical protein